MVKQIRKKLYYQIRFSLASPVAVGSGTNLRADKDIIRDARGIPYIPASGIAGMLKEAVGRVIADKERINACFGDVEIAKEANQKTKQIESRLVFYDARLCEEGTYHTSVRDSVKLDAFKTAVDGAKFDMEVLEPGTGLYTFLEWSGAEGDDDSEILQIMTDAFLKGEVRFGAKGMRGYGAICDARIRRLSFDLSDASDAKKWIAFDLFSPDAFSYAEDVPVADSMDAGMFTLHLGLKQAGGLSIRRYTTTVKKDNTQAQPDFEQLTTHTEGGVKPTIPGTSWAGAFRHGIKKLGMTEEEAEALFGKVDENKKIREKSRILFGETILEGAYEKILSRNAIDRFSGGTKDGALFTEKTVYDGKTTLRIGFERRKGTGAMNDRQRRFLAAAIADLHNGFLAVGGETSIGRGLFTVESINGEEVTDTDIYEHVLRLLEEGKA